MAIEAPRAPRRTLRIPGFRGKDKDGRVFKPTELAFQDALEQAPTVENGDLTTSRFTSATLATRLASNSAIPTGATYFLGIGGRSDRERHIDVFMAGHPEGSQLTLQTGQHNIQVLFDKKSRVAYLNFRIGEEQTPSMVNISKQEFADQMIKCVGEDLKSARDKWMQGNEEARDGFFEQVKSEHGEDILADLRIVLDSLKLASQGQNTLIDAMLGNTDNDRRDNKIPRHIIVRTTLPLDTSVAKRFFDFALPQAKGARGAFHVGYEHPAGRRATIESSPWMLYQRPDGKVIGVTHDVDPFSFTERRWIMEASFKQQILTGQKLTTEHNFAIVGYTGHLKNRPFGT